jgi:enediyne polyketide synthase
LATSSRLGGTAPPARFADERRWRKGAGATEPVAPLTMAFDTDLSHSNFVANIYFSHYGTMFERAALRMLGGASTSAWDSLVVSWLRVDHLGEARPGDQLAAEVELESIGARSLVVSGRFVNRSHGAAAIAAARARLRPLLASSHGPHWGEDLPPADASMAAEERRQAVG